MHIATKETLNLYRTTPTNIHYPVKVNVLLFPEKFTTAGQYADLLNNYLTLSPGAYICQITSFDIKISDSESKTIYTPELSIPFEVKENQISSLLGEFEVCINQ